MESMLPEYMTNPKCGLDIYETQSADDWVSCNTSAAKTGAYIGSAIIICIMLVFYFTTDSTFWAIIYILGAMALCTALFVNGYYFAESLAKVDYERYENKLASNMANGLTRAEAITEMKREAAVLKAAQIQANATRQQGAMLAMALRGK